MQIIMNTIFVLSYESKFFIFQNHYNNVLILQQKFSSRTVFIGEWAFSWSPMREGGSPTEESLILKSVGGQRL